MQAKSVSFASRYTYYSIQKVKTFTPPSPDKAFVFAQLAKNIENACMKTRKYKLASQRVVIFLRTQQFQDLGREIDLSGPTQFPNDILRAVTPAFEELFAPRTLYRATGVILLKLTEAYYGQLDLFGEAIRMQRLSNLYESVDNLREKYGKRLNQTTQHWHTGYPAQRAVPMPAGDQVYESPVD